MKEKIFKIVSIVIAVILLVIAGLCLILGLGSIGAQGWGGLGVIFILPSLIAIGIIVLDLLVTIGKIEDGFVYSIVSTAIKLLLFLALIPSLIYNIKYEIRFHISNLGFDIVLMLLLLVMAVPSVLNVLRKYKERKNK